MDEHPAQIEPPTSTLECAPEWAASRSAPEWIEPPKPAFNLALYFGLLAASLVGSLAILPFSYTLMMQMDIATPTGRNSNCPGGHGRDRAATVGDGDRRGGLARSEAR